MLASEYYRRADTRVVGRTGYSVLSLVFAVIGFFFFLVIAQGLIDDLREHSFQAWSLSEGMIGLLKFMFVGMLAVFGATFGMQLGRAPAGRRLSLLRTVLAILFVFLVLWLLSWALGIGVLSFIGALLLLLVRASVVVIVVVILLLVAAWMLLRSRGETVVVE